ncbi:peptidoglycan hydrolase [Hafnia alvei]|uniref:Flagellar protein FlgJ n=1 Tax=Hafnia alvei TaxID=569 RepID=A0A1C6Z4T7_HAFAL|nr:peptidoglycan hydrolase [Hafnia alvei]SCM54074.1 flagellar protein FlgJ [Hafnia alvei]
MIDAINRQSTVLPGDFTGTLKAQNLDQAAEQFEAMFLRSMMQQMRKASDALAADDDPFNSKQQRMMRDFYDDKLASQLASQRSSGIATMLINQLDPQVKGMERALKIESENVASDPVEAQEPVELETPVIPVLSRGQESL